MHPVCWLTTAGCVLMLTMLITGCASMPKDALRLSPQSLQLRQLETRRFDGTDEKQILAASAGLLQDLGFNIDESETPLGLVVASKERSAVTATQVTGAVIAALFGINQPIYKLQKIRVCLVVRPTKNDIRAADARDFYVRVTFQRIVRDTAGTITRTESIEEPPIYQEFFAMLSKSLFLEAQQI